MFEVGWWGCFGLGWTTLVLLGDTTTVWLLRFFTFITFIYIFVEFVITMSYVWRGYNLHGWAIRATQGNSCYGPRTSISHALLVVNRRNILQPLRNLGT